MDKDLPHGSLVVRTLRSPVKLSLSTTVIRDCKVVLFYQKSTKNQPKKLVYNLNWGNYVISSFSSSFSDGPFETLYADITVTESADFGFIALL